MFEKIIPPEIRNDLFYGYPYQISMVPQFKNFLEIGASSSLGSTQAFVTGIEQREDVGKISLFPMEISNVRFDALVNEYKNKPFVKCFRLSSISSIKFPTKEEMIAFYNYSRSALGQYSL